jgi:hypothetical protein
MPEEINSEEIYQMSEEIKKYILSRWEPGKAMTAVSVLYAQILSVMEPEDKLRVVRWTLELADEFALLRRSEGGRE